MDLNALKYMVEKNGHKLLYLTKFGSHLYGTNSETSDEDYKGLFLPSRESCLLGTAPKSFTFNTKTNKDAKNTADDTDVQLWSLQYFLHLLGQGETNAIDLLYSYSYRKMVVYDDHSTYSKENHYPGYRVLESVLGFLYENHKKLFSVKNTKSFVGYAIGQARKYGVKGSKLGVVKKILEFLDCIKACYITNDKLSRHIKFLLDECGDPSYCFVKTVESKPTPKETLFVNGSQHHLDITIAEFYNRMKKEYDTYGERARQAEANEGLDYKALSHAVRAIRQMEMLLQVGEIQYPLACAEELKAVKQGKLTWQEIEKLISEGLDNVENLQANLPSEHELDANFVEAFILKCY